MSRGANPARGEAVVMVVGADDTVSERVIVVDRVTDNQWIVNSGLVAGEQVVVEGLQKVRFDRELQPRHGRHVAGEQEKKARRGGL